MKDKTTHLYVDSHERTLILHSLVELKNALIRQGRYTDCIDELIFKVANAPVKRMKVKYDYLAGDFIANTRLFHCRNRCRPWYERRYRL